MNDNLKERLLSAGPVDAGLREQYESELKDMIYRKLRPREKRLYGMASVISVLLTIVFGFAAVRLEFLDITFSLMCVSLGIYSAVIGVRLALITRHGQSDRRKSTKWQIGMAYYVVVIGLWFACVFRADKIGLSVDTLIIMFFPLLLGIIVFCTGWIAHLIAQAELSRREEMLEIKLQLALMAKCQEGVDR